MREQHQQNENSLFSSIFYLARFIFRAFLLSLCCFFVAIGLLFIIYLGDIFINNVTGHPKSPLFSTYIIVSPSMVPTINVQDAIIVKREKDDNYQLGDIITFLVNTGDYEGSKVTHRIIRKEEGNEKELVYQTKGDNNSIPDPSLVAAKEIQGKVVLKIPKIGKVQVFFSKPKNYFLCLLIPATFIFIFNLMRIVTMMNQRKEI